ncbi:MAG: DUF6447 family protein [Sulfitobacter sp.]
MTMIKIDGKDYDSDNLPDEAKDHINNMQLCDQRLQQINRDLAITQTARNAYSQALKAALPKNA